MSAIKAGRRFGNRGFKSIQRAEKVTINVGELGSLVGEGKVVDLTSLGIDKLLGAGSLAEEVKGKEIRVKSASAKAIEKVKSAELVLEGEKEMESG
jgi:ribosomal protein L15